MPEEKEQRVKSINSVKQKKVIMKKSNLNLAATVMICGAFLFSSCIGSFGLHSKLVNWNQSIGIWLATLSPYILFAIWQMRW